MNCCNPIIATNAGGIPYVVSNNTTIGTETVNISLGYRQVKPVGYITIVISDTIPTGTTGTLPVTFTMNDVTRTLVLPDGTPVTAADLIGVNTIFVLNDRSRGLLILISPTVA